MIQFRIAYGRRLYGLLCRHTVAGAMCGALCELLLYNIVVARCVALYGRRRYFLYKYQSAAFAAYQIVLTFCSLCGRSLVAFCQCVRGVRSRCRSDPVKVCRASGLLWACLSICRVSAVVSICPAFRLDHAAGCQSSGVLF